MNPGSPQEGDKIDAEADSSAIAEARVYRHIGNALSDWGVRVGSEFDPSDVHQHLLELEAAGKIDVQGTKFVRSKK